MYGSNRTGWHNGLIIVVGVALITAIASAFGVYMILGGEAGSPAGAGESDIDSVLLDLGKAYEREAELESELDASMAEVERLKEEINRLEAKIDSLEAWTAEPTFEPTADPDRFTAVTELLKYPPVSYANVALYYEDIESGESYVFNGDKVFYGASLVKLPFALELLMHLETMEDDGLDDIFTYTKDCWQYGSGTIVYSEPGTKFTYYELLIRLLRDSDNVALEELSKKYGRSLITDFAEREGIETLSQYDWSMTASDCAKILRRAYEYISGDYKYSDEIKNTMLGSGHRVMLCSSGKPVAHKYGWDEGAYHDIGVVYGTDCDGNDRPYYLAVLTDLDSGSNDAEVNRYIQTLVRIIDKIHTSLAGAKKV